MHWFLKENYSMEQTRKFQRTIDAIFLSHLVTNAAAIYSKSKVDGPTNIGQTLLKYFSNLQNEYGVEQESHDDHRQDGFAVVQFAKSSTQEKPWCEDA